MICRIQMGNSGHPRNMPVDAPPLEQIKHLTTEFRESWSRTRAGRTAGSPTHVEIMVVSALAFGNASGAISTLCPQRGTAADAESKIMQLKEAIHGRRAVRDYRDQPVDKAAVTTLVQAAIQAPSAINQQPWAFVVIQDKALLSLYIPDVPKCCAAKRWTRSRCQGSSRQCFPTHRSTFSTIAAHSS